MTQPLHVTSLEEAKAYIYAIDFSQVIDRMVKKDKWKRSEALKACEFYKNYLFLVKKYNDIGVGIPPSDDVDEFWHNHILDTQKYIHDCDVIFGRYLQHYPYFGIDEKSNMQDLNRAFEKMQQLHKKEFGDYVYRVRRLTIRDIINTCAQIVKELFVKKRLP